MERACFFRMACLHYYRKQLSPSESCKPHPIRDYRGVTSGVQLIPSEYMCDGCLGMEIAVEDSEAAW
jgi:hypothetical protein